MAVSNFGQLCRPADRRAKM